MKYFWNQSIRIGLLLIGLMGWSLPGMAQDGKTLIPNISPIYPQVLQAIEHLEAGERIQIFLATEKETYVVGEPFEARFAVSEDAYVALMRIATNGTLTFLTPNPQNSNGKVQGNVVYSTGTSASDGQTAYDFGLNLFTEAPAGNEVLNLFCSPEQLLLFDAEDLEDGLYIVRPDDEERLQALLERIQRLSQTEWAGTSVAFLVEPVAAPASAPAPSASKEMPASGKSSLLEKSALIPDAGTQKTVRRKFGALLPIGGTGTTGKMFPMPGTNATENLFTPGQ